MIVNEGSTAYVKVSFTDKTGALAAPTSLTYSLHCQTTGTVLRTHVALTPASEVEIVLSPTDNAIQAASNAYETKLLTVVAGYGSDDALKSDYEYQVRNLARA